MAEASTMPPSVLALTGGGTSTSQQPTPWTTGMASAQGLEAGLKYISQVAKKAGQWRDYYNPLRGLVMQRIVSFVEQGQRGAYAELQWFYHLMEGADATVCALMARRLSAIKRLDPTIRATPVNKLPAGVSQSLVDEQEQCAKEAIVRIDNMREAIEFLALASFRQFSHLEKHHADWNAPSVENVNHLEPVPQWYWVRLGLNGLWEFNDRAKSGTNRGMPIEYNDFIIREIERPVNRIAAVCFMRKAMSTKDWDGFIEVYGIPMIFVIGPPNVQKDKESEWQQVAEDMISNGRGYLPHGSEVENPGADTRGVNPFRDHLRYQDEQIVLAGTGGLLTMLTESGSGTLAGGAHKDTFDKIADAEGKEISEGCIQKQLIIPLLNEKFPGQPVLVHFELSGGDPEGVAAIIDHNSKLALSGRQISIEQLEEKTGYDIEDKPVAPAPAFPPRPGVVEPTEPNEPVQNRRVSALRNRQAAADADLRAVAEAINADIGEPLRKKYGALLNRVSELAAQEDEEKFRVELDALKPELMAMVADLPNLLPKESKLAGVFDRVLTKAMEDGLCGTPEPVQVRHSFAKAGAK